MLAPQCCTFSSNNVIPHLLHTIQSFHTEGGVGGGGGGGGAGIPPPPASHRNLEIEYGSYCGAIDISCLILHVTGHKYVSSKCCLESLSQIASEAI